MLQIVLQILAIIGIILLCLLLLVLLMLGLVLFVPIRYNITGRKEKENMEVLVRAGWLFRLVSFWFAYPDEGANQVKVLGIPVYRFGKAQEVWEKKQKQKDAKQKTKKTSKAKNEENAGGESVAKETDKMNENALKEKTAKEHQGKSVGSENVELTEVTTEEKKLSWWQKILEKIKSFIDKIKYTIRKICDTLKNINEAKEYYLALFEEEETKAVLKRNKDRIFSLLKKLKPKYLNANLILGTGSPDTTGYVLALHGMFYGILGETVFITPDFEQAILEGTFQAKGGIRIWTLLRAGIQFYMDKELKTFIGKLKREDIENGR